MPTQLATKTKCLPVSRAVLDGEIGGDKPGKTNKEEEKDMSSSTNSVKTQSHSFTKKLLTWALYSTLPIALFRFFFYPLYLPLLSTDPLTSSNLITITTNSSSSSSPPPPLPFSSSSFSQEEESANKSSLCDYTNGKWVIDKLGSLYNETTCGTIKEGQNCISHGRPDLGYLFWRWKPKQCNLPRFEPNTFLQLIKNKHVAFVGDSMARNQLESLLCLLSTVSVPNLVYRNGDDNKFRRWHFPSHNANVSVYWSPFLVDGIEKSNDGHGPNHNILYLERASERWAVDLDQMDKIVLSVGHWFLHPAVYYEGGSVLGCHFCTGLNHTEIGFYEVLRKAVRTTLKTLIERRGGKGNHGIEVILTTFSPAHFEGEWDKAGACSKKRPYTKGEKVLEGMDAEMRKVEVEEVEVAKKNAKGKLGIKIEALDVSQLSLMRPDGHPGPYMHPFPFANGITERVQNDCVHWCLPGAIDTWNEILLQVYKRWDQLNREN